MRSATAVLVALVLIVGGCGSGSAARRELRQTAQRLGQIRSGNLTLRLLVTGSKGKKSRIGFQLRGPFQLRANALPIAKIDYTQYAGARQATATFVSTGTQAYALVSGKHVPIPPSDTAQIESAASGLGVGDGSGLRIDSWLKDPSVSDGGTVGGAVVVGAVVVGVVVVGGGGGGGGSVVAGGGVVWIVVERVGVDGVDVDV